LAFDSWVFDLEKRELIGPDSVSIPLGTTDFRLLEIFALRPNIVLTREQLLDLTASRAPQLFDRSIDNQVSRLRKKIEADPRKPTLIKTVRRDGYVFATEVRTLKP
jgi:two-component system, OmpR family, response regulator